MQMYRVALAATVAALSGSAAADQVYVDFQGTSGNHGNAVSIQLSGGLFFQDGSSSKSVWAGQLSAAIDGQDVKTYCTELTQWAGDGWFDVVSVDNAPNPGVGMGVTKAEAIYRLFNATNGAEDIDSNSKAAAFQAVIWEIVYDYSGTESSIGTGTGNVRINSGINSTLFAQYAGYATDTANGDATISINAVVNPDRQDLLTVIPLPSAGTMAGLGIAGLGFRRRRTA